MIFDLERKFVADIVGVIRKFVVIFVILNKSSLQFLLSVNTAGSESGGDIEGKEFKNIRRKVFTRDICAHFYGRLPHGEMADESAALCDWGTGKPVCRAERKVKQGKNQRTIMEGTSWWSYFYGGKKAIENIFSVYQKFSYVDGNCSGEIVYYPFYMISPMKLFYYYSVYDEESRQKGAAVIRGKSREDEGIANPVVLKAKNYTLKPNEYYGNTIAGYSDGSLAISLKYCQTYVKTIVPSL